MKSLLKCGIFSCALLYSIPPVASNSVGQSFDEWVEEFRREAVEDGVSAQMLDYAFRDLQPVPKVVQSDRKQPEFRRDFQTYLDNAINGSRIRRARNLLEKHAELFKEIEKKYHVPAYYLASFWGMETDFGNAKGDFSTLNALATLAYDTRRPAFFRTELMHAVHLVQNGVPVEKMRGSWAGAGGHFQFMPSTFSHFGTDYDNDGQIDLWDSLPDALASAANYLSAEGWKNDVGWGREVLLPKKFDWNMIEHQKTLKEWLDDGVSFADPADVKEPLSTMAKLFLPAGIHGPAFLTYSNFDVILKWNKSVLYAIAIGHLADRIQAKPPFSKKYFQRGAMFTMENAQEVQELLAKMGLYEDGIDGFLGRKSREAVRKFQNLYGLPADGYANASLLHFMRLAVGGGEKRKALTFDEITELQRILTQGSYYIGPVDGKLGRATLAGIDLFKTVYGIEADGVNRTLLEKMRVQFARGMENGEIDPLVKEHIKREAERKKALEKERRKAEQKRRKLLKKQKKNKKEDKAVKHRAVKVGKNVSKKTKVSKKSALSP